MNELRRTIGDDHLWQVLFSTGTLADEVNGYRCEWSDKLRYGMFVSFVAKKLELSEYRSEFSSTPNHIGDHLPKHDIWDGLAFATRCSCMCEILTNYVYHVQESTGS